MLDFTSLLGRYMPHKGNGMLQAQKAQFAPVIRRWAARMFFLIYPVHLADYKVALVSRQEIYAE